MVGLTFEKCVLLSIWSVQLSTPLGCVTGLRASEESEENYHVRMMSTSY
jgi:hypothetical protein